MAACPYNIKFGTKVLIIGADLSQLGLPQVLICEDRFAKQYAYGHLDIAIVTGNDKERIAMAKKFGRKRLKVFYLEE